MVFLQNAAVLVRLTNLAFIVQGLTWCGVFSKNKFKLILSLAAGVDGWGSSPFWMRLFTYLKNLSAFCFPAALLRCVDRSELY